MTKSHTSHTAGLHQHALDAALQREEQQANAVSALMIMGLFGGTVIPLIMGFASDAVGQLGAVIVMTAAACYLVALAVKLK